MTAAELIRSARSRAGLAQHELARLLDTPRSQIGRWESGEVEPAFATVRRVLRACGFDLSMALVPFDPEAPQVARLVELSRLTPKERLDAALMRGGSEQKNYPFDPYVVLRKLDELRVENILVGSLARVLQGADEIPKELRSRDPEGAPASRATRRSSRSPCAASASIGTETRGSTGYRGRSCGCGRSPRGPRGTGTCAGAPSVSTSAAAFDHGSLRRVIWFGCWRRLGGPSKRSSSRRCGGWSRLDRGLSPRP